MKDLDDLLQHFLDVGDTANNYNKVIRVRDKFIKYREAYIRMLSQEQPTINVYYDKPSKE